MDIRVLAIVAILYLGTIGYLGFRGYMATRSTSDYMLAGGSIHPYVMALSYGAAFISTSAIVGFGGAAAVFGMGVLWLTFLNIAVGIFIAFAVFGKRTRKMGHHLQAHTFPELLGRRFNSRFIQAFAGVIVVLFMPLYASAVLIGAARYLEGTFAGVSFEIAVTLFSLLIAGYVVAGGLKGVMYADALQGSLMFIGMSILIVFTYVQMGGINTAHRKLDQLPADVEAGYQELTPTLRALAPEGLDDDALLGWFTEQSTLFRGANPFEDEEARAAFDAEHPDALAIGGLLEAHPVLRSKLAIDQLRRGGFQGWTRMPTRGSSMFYVLVTSIVLGVGIGVLAQPQLAVRFMTVKSSRELNRAVLVGGVFILFMTGVAFMVGNLSNVWFARPENGGTISLASVPGGNIDLIIPSYINSALPSWFGAVFMLTLLSAAMSTLSSQFHAMGTSIGRDVFERGILGSYEHGSTVIITRIGVILAILVTVVLSFILPAGIVAAATAIFFGLCASAFLPAFVGGLFWRRMTRVGAIASLCVGFGMSFFWVMFVQMPSGRLPAILANALLGQPTLLPDPVMGIHWNWIEALVVCLPLSALTAVVVSLLTQPEPDSHLELCFNGQKSTSK